MRLASERDVYTRFERNVRTLAPGNVTATRQTSTAALSGWSVGPIKFTHIDGSHDYESVMRDIRLIRPHVPVGGVICGHDLLTANRDRHDLDGGVERAVIESFGFDGFERIGNLWVWQRSE